MGKFFSALVTTLFLTGAANAGTQFLAVECISSSTNIVLLQSDENSVLVLADGTLVARGKKITAKTVADATLAKCAYGYTTAELDIDDDGVSRWVDTFHKTTWNVIETDTSRGSTVLTCKPGSKVDSFDTRADMIDSAKTVVTGLINSSITKFSRACIR